MRAGAAFALLSAVFVGVVAVSTRLLTDRWFGSKGADWFSVVEMVSLVVAALVTVAAMCLDSRRR